MYTQCPHCQTCFRIAEAHLKAAKGKVRCGSCQEVFDATGHLYTKLPAVPENMIPPADDISISPQDLARVEHEHIDLSATPVKGKTKIPTEQADQSEFMESTIGTNSRYNNLDDMEPVKIPGELELDDSLIKLGKPPEQQAEEESASENPYEDVESKERPVSNEEADQIRDLYTAADELLHTGDEDNQDDIDKHIDELLAFTRSLDKNKDRSDLATDNFEEDEFDDFDDLDDLDDLNVETTPAATTPIDEKNKQLKDDAEPSLNISSMVVTRHHPDFIKTIGLGERDISGKGALSFLSGSAIYDDFGEPLALCVVGKLLNQNHEPLEKLFKISGAVSVLYLDTAPIAYAGFSEKGSNHLDPSHLLLDQESQANIYAADKPLHMNVTFGEESYLTTCSVIKSNKGEPIGSFLAGIPQAKVIASQKAMLSYGIQTKKDVQSWIVGN